MMSTVPQAKIPYTVLLGRVLLQYREQRRLQQSDIAAALGISQPAYSRIEQGGTSITVSQLRKIGVRLDIAPSRILGEVERRVRLLKDKRVQVTDEKEVPQAALLVGLGILAAVLATASSSG